MSKPPGEVRAELVRGWVEMTSPGQGSDEVTDRSVSVLAETPAVTGQS